MHSVWSRCRCFRFGWKEKQKLLMVKAEGRSVLETKRGGKNIGKPGLTGWGEVLLKLESLMVQASSVRGSHRLQRWPDSSGPQLVVAGELPRAQRVRGRAPWLFPHYVALEENSLRTILPSRYIYYIRIS